MTSDHLRVLIASPLEPEHVAHIEAADPRVTVLYEPGLHTRRLIGASELALMRPGSVLVNIARGAVVDEEAMVAALSSGHLGGACLDVFATEPLPESSPLWDMPNVIISPQSAATVAAENGLITGIFVDNLQRWLAGRPLRNVYDRSVGY